MVREVLTLETRELKLGVTSSRLSSVRSRSERETAVRVYDDGRVGTASGVGDVSVDALTDQARDALSLGIPYAPLPGAERALSASHSGAEMGLSDLRELTESLLVRLRELYPKLVLSEGVSHTRRAFSLRNDQGLDLSYDLSNTAAVFLVKERGSANIIDSFAFAEGTELTLETALADIRSKLDKHDELAPAPRGRTRVIFASTAPHAGGALLQLFERGCLARPYATGSSIFSGRIGDTSRPFHPAFRLVDARDPAGGRVCPFDAEGVVRTDLGLSLDLDLVRDGALRNVATDKRDALRFGLPATGSATGPLEALPISGFSSLTVAPTAPTLAHLLDGEEGVLVWMSAGGDVTATGDIALPAQVAFRLSPDGAITHRLEGAIFTGNLFEVFGEGFIGSSEETVTPRSDDRWLAAYMMAQG